MSLRLWESCKSVHRIFREAASSLQSPFLLAVRLYWGWQFYQTGWGKLHHLDKIIQFFASLGLPAPAFTATLVGTIEFVGGILLVLGLSSRLTSLALFVSMSVAYLTAERSSLMSIFSDPGKFYGSDAYTFWFAALLVLLFGPGKFALDSLIGKAPRSVNNAPSKYSNGQTVTHGPAKL